MSALVDLVVPPFAGHLHPLLGVGRRLAREHEVRVLSTERAQEAIAAAGLVGVVLLAGRDDEITAIVETPQAVGSHPLRLNAQLRANLALLGQFQAELETIWNRRAPDLVIADFTLPVAGAVAVRRGIPWWTSHQSPCVIEAADGPPGYLGGWRPGRGALGRLRDAAGRLLVRTGKRAIHRLHRRQLARLGFPALYRRDGGEAVYSADTLLAFGVRELEFERRLPAAVALVGPVLYTPPPAGAPPEIPFVAGRRHVLVTLGTHLAWRKDAMAESVRRAARALPDLELHMSDGQAKGRRHEADGNFHRFSYVPYPSHLERYDLVVHHGGAGIVYHTLRAGLPAVVAPVDYDQFDFAARLETAGLAHRLRRPGDLAAAIGAALADADLAAACRRFQDVLAGYDAEETIARRVTASIGRARRA